MSFRKIVFLILLLVITFFVSIIVCSILDHEIFNIKDFGFQFIMFSILGSFIYFTSLHLKLFDSLIVSIFFAIIFAFILKKTSMFITFGGIIPLLIYTVLLFLVYAVIFRYIWFSGSRYLRNIMFSIVASCGYCLVHVLAHTFFQIPLNGEFILLYFINGLKLMITLSVSFSLAELAMIKLDNLFFKIPERIKPADLEDKEDSKE
ncbi:MAG: hypothetical protein K8R49_07810 [Candidatus Cloacimonetes bacterium]|nr:hypothetical protein [Candidatus Cloacimonadota bacterium]